ncbi:hypothetical protein FDA94_28765 [Herbidospora galbida]|uniref:Uncharacterized protein n=1 Tax=Herbidospora galbida TaxID=2575442 RepID=A0A4U3M992_9ACTN|nr:hypothetical protein [Herbidospora galbida]TKK84624.1 hypothetical protein FDA94_28765 [Herbidospora galbida]
MSAPERYFIDFATSEMASWIASMPELADVPAATVAGWRVTMYSAALDVLKELDNEHDGFYDGTSIWVSGDEFTVHALTETVDLLERVLYDLAVRAKSRIFQFGSDYLALHPEDAQAGEKEDDPFDTLLSAELMRIEGIAEAMELVLGFDDKGRPSRAVRVKDLINTSEVTALKERVNARAGRPIFDI